MNSSRQLFLYVSDKGESFKSDHAALLSILRNEGVSATGFGSSSPQSKPYNYLVSWFYNCCLQPSFTMSFVLHTFTDGLFLSYGFWVYLWLITDLTIFRTCLIIIFFVFTCLQPQRVSVMKSRQKAGPTTGEHQTENTPCAWINSLSSQKILLLLNAITVTGWHSGTVLYF